MIQKNLTLSLDFPSPVASTALPLGDDLRALSLTQPWATLVVLLSAPAALTGEKEYETRSRPIYSLLGRVIAVHASKSFPKQARAICLEEPYRSVLAVHGYTSDNLPTASIVGTVKMLDCEHTEDVRSRISAQEVAFGNYDDGRYAYRLANPHRFAQVIPCAGFQGFWRVKEPELRLVRAAWTVEKATGNSRGLPVE